MPIMPHSSQAPISRVESTPAMNGNGANGHKKSDPDPGRDKQGFITPEALRKHWGKGKGKVTQTAEEQIGAPGIELEDTSDTTQEEAPAAGNGTQTQTQQSPAAASAQQETEEQKSLREARNRFMSALMSAHGVNLRKFTPDPQEKNDGYRQFNFLYATSQVVAADQTHAIFKASSLPGSFDISPKSIQFIAETPEKTGKDIGFTYAHAQYMALQAAQSDASKTVKLGGTREQKYLLQLAIEDQNKFLPAHQKIKISNPIQFFKPNLQATGNFESFMDSVAPAPVQESTPVPTNPGPVIGGAIRENPYNSRPVAPPPPTAAKTAAPATSKATQPSKAQEQLDQFTALVTGFEQDSIKKSAKIAGKTEDGQTAYQAKLRLDDAPKRSFTTVVFTAPEGSERKIVSIAKTDDYAGYQSPDIKLKTPEAVPRGFLDKGFRTAISGGSPVERAPHEVSAPSSPQNPCSSCATGACSTCNSVSPPPPPARGNDERAHAPL